MLSRAFPVVFALCLTFGPAAGRAAEETTKSPTLVVRLQSIEGLRGDASYLAKVLGQEDKSKQAEGFLNSMTSEKGLVGIDVKRPLGFYGTMTKDLLNSTGVVLLPVADEKAILDFLQGFNIEAKKGPDDVYTINSPMIPSQAPVYLRFANNYVYITARDKAALAKNNLLDADQVLSTDKKAGLYARFRLDQVPEGIKQLALGGIAAKLVEQEGQHRSGESRAEQELRTQTLKNLGQHWGAVIKDGGDLEIRVNVDRQDAEISAQLSFAGKRDSSIRMAIANLGQAKSLFAGLLDDQAAVNVLVHCDMPDGLRQAMGPVIDEKLEEAITKEKDESKRQALKKLSKAIEPTLKAGELDVGVRIGGPDASQQYSILVGIKVKDGQQIDKALQDAVKDLPADEQDKIKKKIRWNAETIDGVSVHQLDVSKDMDADARRRFGDNPFYLAFRDNALLIAGGNDGLKVLRDAFHLEPKAAPEILVNVSVARAAPFFADHGKHSPEAIKKAASSAFGQSVEGDRVRFTIEGGESLKMQLHVQAAVLKFMHELHDNDHHAGHSKKHKESDD
jgi:hypothetical protein